MNDFASDFQARQLPSAGTQRAVDPLAEYHSAKSILVRCLVPFRCNGRIIQPGQCVDVAAADAVKLIAGGEAERGE